MIAPAITQPIAFVPLFMERVWGGRGLASVYGKQLPADTTIGESWELVDRPEAQSVVRDGPFAGRTLHELWTDHRPEIFGRDLPDVPRFPLLVKLLDAQEKLSLQVHPPTVVAEELGGEPKTEFWYIAHAEPGAELFVGLRKDSDRSRFKTAINEGTVADHVHRIAVKNGDAMFLPSGRLHAIGAGNLIVEIQQNSDTTYRVFDWNRPGADGQPRQLHVAESLRCIDFADCEPALTKARGESLVSHNDFAIEKWELPEPRTVGTPGRFDLIFCLTGKIECGAAPFSPGEFFLLPAALTDRSLKPAAASTALLRVTIPPTR